jgi:hypothetical protein
MNGSLFPCSTQITQGNFLDTEADADVDTDDVSSIEGNCIEAENVELIMGYNSYFI